MIAILSDFGPSSYVGVMRAVIYKKNPEAKVMDLTNDITPQSITEGAWILAQDYQWYPHNTVFLCVVDPGVGTNRQPIAVRTSRYFWVGPDNGLMYPAMIKDGIQEVARLDDRGASRTFHGRDVFAPAAAALDQHHFVKNLGEPTDIQYQSVFHLKDREGEVVHIDHFGNIATNLPHIGKEEYQVKTKDHDRTLHFYEAYGDAPANEPFLITSSWDTLEIAVKDGSARDHFSLRARDRITISPLE